MSNTHGMKDGNYWKMWNDVGHMPSEDFQGAIMRVRYVKIKQGKNEEYRTLLNAIQKVYVPIVLKVAREFMITGRVRRGRCSPCMAISGLGYF